MTRAALLRRLAAVEARLVPPPGYAGPRLILVCHSGHPPPDPAWVAAEQAASRATGMPFYITCLPECPPDCPYCADPHLYERTADTPALPPGSKVYSGFDPDAV